jgi:hypothetical protein
VRDVLLDEIGQRERAAAEFDRLREAERAAAARSDVLVARRYVEG